MTQTDFEPNLSFVTLADDGYTLLLNDDQRYSVRLPMNLSRLKAAEKQSAIESTILNACNSYGVDYVSMDNIKRRAKEIVDVIYARARVTKNHVVQPSHPIITEQYRNDYFEFLIACIKRVVKEENALVRQITYTMLSAYCNDPINLGVLAPTSTGKSYPIKAVSEYTPGGKEVRIIGSMTPKVLIREQGLLIDKNGNPIGKEVRRLRAAISEAKKSNKKNSSKAVEQYQDELAVLLEDSAYLIDFSNCTLIFLEPPHPELWNLLKPILSHDSYEMEHPFVEKVGGGAMQVKRVITRGWPACIFCSSKDESKWDMWPEIESRFMIQSPNTVQAKFHAGNKLIAQRKGLPRAVKQQVIISDFEKALGQKCFLYLKHQIQQATATTDSPVWIPFGELLAEFLPDDRGQDNRASNRLFTMINIIALAKAHLRHRLIFDDEELVIATLQDLREALHVLQNMTGLPPHKLRFYNQYILPLYKSKGTALETREICDFYNANNKKGSMKMNSNNLLKTYLYELVNHSYLEQEKDEDTKALRYKFTPLVENEEEEEEQNKQPSTSSTLSPVYQYLQFSWLIIPENHMGIPKNWLNQEILQLSKRTLSNRVLKILDNKGNDIPIDDFVQLYETQDDIKLHDFFKVSRLVDSPKSAEFTTSEDNKGGSNEKITENNNQDDKKRYTRPKVDGVDDMIQKAVRYGTTQGDDKGHFTKGDFAFVATMRPNEHWTDDEIEQTLQQLLQEGKIREVEAGKYEPVGDS